MLLRDRGLSLQSSVGILLLSQVLVLLGLLIHQDQLSIVSSASWSWLSV
jgi:hypothetical protein